MWFHFRSSNLGAVIAAPMASRPRIMGRSLEPTERAFEALNLLHDLLNGGELLRGVTDGVLPLGKLLNWIRSPCHRIDRLRLSATGEKGDGAGQGDQVISRHRGPLSGRSGGARSGRTRSYRQHRLWQPHSSPRQDRPPARRTGEPRPCVMPDR